MKYVPHNFKFFLILALLFLYRHTLSDDAISIHQGPQTNMPALTLLNPAAQGPYTTVTFQKQAHTLISSDSARIISPKHRSILNQESVEYTLQPVCPVSRVDLFVSYYPSRTDTLARLSKPPFSVEWHTADLPDQDQLHLQFGYTLYHVNGDTIIAAPQPHHWIIDRNTKQSRKRHACKQAPSDKKFSIDGRLDEWKKFRRKPFPSGGGFRCAWTAADFFLAVEIYDPIVTFEDRIEVCFDPTQSRTRFFDINHRIISFGPKSRSFCWAVEINDSTTIQIDSLIIRINEEMEWRSRLTEFGYIVEMRIPFCVLSALEFPQKHIGFDIAVIDKNDPRQRTPSVYTWSGAEPAGRHNPAEWGTIILRQLFLPLKLLLVITLFFVTLLIVGMTALILYRKRKDYYYEKLVKKGLSPKLREIIAIVERHIKRPDLSPEDVAGHYGCRISALEKIFNHELNTSCQKHIVFSRIKKAKTLLVDTEMSIESISKETGFTGTDIFTNTFTSLAGVPPEKWRKNRLEDLIEDEEEEEDR